MSTFGSAREVMVSGATGYVAGWLIKRLLEDGHHVHAAVRDPANEQKLAHLNALQSDLPGTITYFASDLLTEGSYAEAMAGCEIVFHTASPFSLTVKDAQRELVEPAKLGTRNVLEQAKRTPSVKCVVVTSSYVAVFGDNADFLAGDKEFFNEGDWNTMSSLTHQPYSFSKTEAEKEAWKIAQTQDQWRLVTVNPAFIMGPGISPSATSESFNFMKQLADGTFKSGIPNFGVGLVDVREVADAHLGAAFIPEAEGRYLISAKNSSVPEIAQILRDQFGNDFPFPKRIIPKGLSWLIGPLVDKTRSRRVIALNVGYPVKIDNRKSIRELGITYRPLEETVTEMFQQLIDEGIVVPS
ncbi:MAG: NAD-dependent epimerase/dehydratase family protein [Spirulinaceae cyanobacterium RM2_2_10]|nr:NAD-dependent epimerase/dehydratase family protein [bacterium]NJO18963.1 NAD-dependent epimerase/dehydratase family protein [Spirulinaceae cyanobacterium RM2_2_10]